jgi:Putative metallopeptidase
MRRKSLLLWFIPVAIIAPSCTTNADKDSGPRFNVVVEYDEPKTETGNVVYQIIGKSSGLTDLSGTLSNRLKMPQNLPVTHQDLKIYNAYYNPQDKTITMDYWVIAYFASTLINLTGLEGDDATNAVENIATFVALHEMGHAFIDLLQLPALGNEEQAADEFATIQLLEAGNGDKALIAAVSFFSLFYYNQMNGGDVSYSDEHPLDAQRFYNIIALIYGSNPAKYGVLVTEGLLPEARAKRSEFDYQEKVKRWDAALAQHIRK